MGGPRVPTERNAMTTSRTQVVHVKRAPYDVDVDGHRPLAIRVSSAAMTTAGP